MRLMSLHARITVEDVVAEMSWQPVLAEHLQTTPPPSEDELRRIRVELDPEGMYR
jgi:glutaconate CoA-transferase subunit B